MLSKAQNKYIRSLSQQKYRKENNVFVVEGDKIAREWLASGEMVQMIVAVADWAEEHHELVHRHAEASVHIVPEHELAAVSQLQTPNKVLLVVRHMPRFPEVEANAWCLALDDIQDPGNMGTIIRIADWFGIPDVVCSPGCVDAYNPKVIQAAMGGHLRVAIHTMHLPDFVKSASVPVLAATLGGESLYEVEPRSSGILVIGNESRGVSEGVLSLATRQVTIPRKGGAESLNAGVSTGILCSHLLQR
ncbi:MAG: RNA methyltransferase [Flavipsychrobacter sp.]|nr:RNA methyltransferase [Flavipsychrobacter sp.]